jgi:molecular chaperone DnaK
MVKDAQAHSDEDKKRKELAEVRNEADTLIYSVEKSLSDYGDKISQAEKTSIQEGIVTARKALEGGDVEAIRSQIQELSKASHKLAEEMYKQTAQPQSKEGEGAQASGGDGGGTSKGNDNVVDADFEEVDKDKK